MKTPKRLLPLIEDGLVDEVLSQLMSGKEATVYTVLCGSEVRCAKVYKDAAKRSFKKAVQYQEGRKVRNSRRSRAMEKGSKFGRDQREEIWQNAEVDALFTLANAGVRVPEPYGCFDGVLINAAGNNNAKSMLERDVRNMTNYYGQFAPELLKTQCAREIWKLYESGELTPETKLTGVIEVDTKPANVDSVMLEIKAAFAEQEERLQRLRDAGE